jgi:hypothetical protein
VYALNAPSGQNANIYAWAGESMALTEEQSQRGRFYRREPVFNSDLGRDLFNDFLSTAAALISILRSAPVDRSE